MTRKRYLALLIDETTGESRTFHQADTLEEILEKLAIEYADYIGDAEGDRAGAKRELRECYRIYEGRPINLPGSQLVIVDWNRGL